jgi:hypothetical protein
MIEATPTASFGAEPAGRSKGGSRGEILRIAAAIAIGTVGPVIRFPEFGQAATLVVVSVAVAVLGRGRGGRVVRGVTAGVLIAALVLSWRGDFARAAAAVLVATIIAEAALLAVPPWRRDAQAGFRVIPPGIALLVVASGHWYLYGSSLGFAFLSCGAALVVVLWVLGGNQPPASLPRGLRREGGHDPAQADVRLGVLTLVALRLKHAWRLGRDVTAFAGGQRMWWLIPTIGIVVAVTVIASATSATVPYLVYTLF